MYHTLPLGATCKLDTLSSLTFTSAENVVDSEKKEETSKIAKSIIIKSLAITLPITIFTYLINQFFEKLQNNL